MNALDFGVRWRWRHGRAETSMNARFRVGGQWGWPENGQNPKSSTDVLDFGVGWRQQHRRAETSTNARFGIGGRWQRPDNNQNPEIKHIRAQFQGWEVAATGEGQSEPRNEHKFSFQGWWQEEGRQNLENKQSCLLSGWEDGGGSQRMSKSRKRACPARFWGWGLINDV